MLASATQARHPLPPTSGWFDEICYEQLLQHGDVRRLILLAGRQRRPHVSGEQILAAFDALVPMGFSLEKLAALLSPLYARMGIKTGKSATQRYSLPPGRVLVGVLCCLASQGIELTRVDQAADGCVIIAKIPSNIWSFAGELVVSVRREGNATLLEAAAQIPGQLYDWGKSRRILDNLLRETQAFAA
jgi:hypothetical protein